MADFNAFVRDSTPGAFTIQTQLQTLTRVYTRATSTLTNRKVRFHKVSCFADLCSFASPTRLNFYFSPAGIPAPLISFPQNTGSWPDFFLRLFFESDGVVTTTIFCIGAFLIYRFMGSPLDVSAEEKQCEREALWAAHNERFKPKNANWKVTRRSGQAKTKQVPNFSRSEHTWRHTKVVSHIVSPNSTLLYHLLSDP